MDATDPGQPRLWVVRLGTRPYDEIAAAQRELREARAAGVVPDLLLLLEHHAVYTKGRRTDPSELGMGEDWYRMQGIEVTETDRGGRVTYHGPGQLVAYPIVDLSAYGDDVAAYVRRLERVMIAALGDHGVPAQVFDGLTGVWTGGEPPVPSGEPGPQGTPVGRATVPSSRGEGARKIGSIGIHVSRGITTHGIAINVANDLQPFEWITPCGIDHVRMTSLSRELGSEQDVELFADTFAPRFAEVFERHMELVGPEELAVRAAAAQPSSSTAI
jgi:lipoate-protein ligase B